MPAGLASLERQAQSLFTIILGAFVFGERLQGKQLAGIALAIFGVLVLVEGARRGACPTGGLYADPGGGAQLACGNIFNKKIMSQATRPPIISLVVSALIPVLPFMFASWLIDGPQLMLASLRQIDMLTVLSLGFTWRLSPPSSAISGARCWGAMKPGGWRRCRRWCR